MMDALGKRRYSEVHEILMDCVDSSPGRQKCEFFVRGFFGNGVSVSFLLSFCGAYMHCRFLIASTSFCGPSLKAVAYSDENVHVLHRDCFAYSQIMITNEVWTINQLNRMTFTFDRSAQLDTGRV
jgi:hypothetical protein